METFNIPEKNKKFFNPNVDEHGRDFTNFFKMMEEFEKSEKGQELISLTSNKIFPRKNNNNNNNNVEFDKDVKNNTTNLDDNVKIELDNAKDFAVNITQNDKCESVIDLTDYDEIHKQNKQKLDNVNIDLISNEDEYEKAVKLLEEAEVAKTEEKEREGLCKATTASGKLCSRSAKEDGYCKQHHKMVNKPKPEPKDPIVEIAKSDIYLISPLQNFHNICNNVKHIDVEYLDVEYLVNDHRTMIVKGPTGCGKTTSYMNLIKKYNKDQVLISVPTQSLARDIVKHEMTNFKSDCPKLYNYLDINERKLDAYEHIIMGFLSFKRRSLDKPFDLIILDEIELICRLVFSDLMIQNGYEELGYYITQHIKKAKKVIAFDASAGTRSYILLEQIRGDDIHVLINDHKPPQQNIKQISIDPKKPMQFVSYVINTIQTTSPENFFLAEVYSIRVANMLHKAALNVGIKSLIHTSKEPNARIQHNVNSEWPKYQLVIYTSTIVVGVDFTAITAFGLFSYMGSKFPLGPQFQMTRRARKIKKIYNFNNSHAIKKYNVPCTFEEAAKRTKLPTIGDEYSLKFVIQQTKNCIKDEEKLLNVPYLRDKAVKQLEVYKQNLDRKIYMLDLIKSINWMKTIAIYNKLEDMCTINHYWELRKMYAELYNWVTCENLEIWKEINPDLYVYQTPKYDEIPDIKSKEERIKLLDKITNGTQNTDESYIIHKDRFKRLINNDISEEGKKWYDGIYRYDDYQAKFIESVIKPENSHSKELIKQRDDIRKVFLELGNYDITKSGWRIRIDKLKFSYDWRTEKCDLYDINQPKPNFNTKDHELNRIILDKMLHKCLNMSLERDPLSKKYCVLKSKANFEKSLTEICGKNLDFCINPLD